MDWNYGNFKLLILLICFTNQFNWSSCGYSAEFVIKNVHCGKYIQPKTSSGRPPYPDPLVLGSSILNPNSRFRFEQVDGIWGYIQNAYDRRFYPIGGTANTRTEGTHLVQSNAKGREQLFAIDQINNHIIHRDGQYVEYDNGYDPYPPDGDNIELTHSVHDGMTWVFLNPKNLSETVYPYGAPKIAGEWELIYAVLKPLATQSWEYSYTVGKSQSKSSSQTLDYHQGFEFTWESSVTATAGGGFSFWGIGSAHAEVSTSFSAGGSISSSLSKQITSASEDTWYGETTETSTVTVPAGKTVVVWQKVFIGSQLGHKAVFQSNIFGYTDSLDVKPED